MNKIDQDLEQRLRDHYRQQIGEPVPSSSVWRKIAGHLPAQESPHSRWQHFLQAFSPTGLTPVPRPARKLVVAFSLVFAILLVSGTVYASGGSALLQQILTNWAGSPQSGLFTRIDQTKTVGDYKVTLEKAYADANNVLVGYTIETRDGKKAISGEAALTTADGAKLPNLKGITTFPLKNREPGAGAGVFQFDASAIKGSPQNVNLHLKIPLGRSAQTAREAVSVADFDFSVPFHGGKAIDVNQDREVNGVKLTLERVVISRTEVRAYIRGIPTEQPVARIVVAGKSSLLNDVRPTGGGSYILSSSASLLDTSGSARLTIQNLDKVNAPGTPSIVLVQGPWTFSFQIP